MKIKNQDIASSIVLYIQSSGITKKTFQQIKKARPKKLFIPQMDLCIKTKKIKSIV